MDDKKLLRLLGKDPNKGMETLMNEYAGLVYATVKGRLSDSRYISSDIEDCVADVFIKFFANLSHYDSSIASIKTYLCVIARNCAVNIAKKRALEGAVYIDDEASFLQIADEVLIEQRLEEDELRHEIIKAVELLGEPDSGIIFRKYYYGQSSKEIAKAVGISVQNVDTRTHRALIKLRKMFGGSEE